MNQMTSLSFGLHYANLLQHHPMTPICSPRSRKIRMLCVFLTSGNQVKPFSSSRVTPPP